MVQLTFYWDAWAIFEEDDIFRMIQREDYEAENWQECCEKCLSCYNWDDSDLVKGYEEKVIETNRKLKEITIHQNGEELEAPKEIYEYFMNSKKKLDTTEFESTKKSVRLDMIN